MPKLQIALALFKMFSFLVLSIYNLCPLKNDISLLELTPLRHLFLPNRLSKPTNEFFNHEGKIS